MLRNSGSLSLLRGRLGVQVVVDNHTIDDSLAAHGWDATKRAQNGSTKVRKPYKKTASNRHAAASDPRAAIPMSQETDMRIQHDPKPLLPVARVHAGVHWGGGQIRGCTRVKFV